MKLLLLNKREKVLILAYYCPIRGMGEKPSPLGEDFGIIKQHVRLPLL